MQTTQTLRWGARSMHGHEVLHIDIRAPRSYLNSRARSTCRSLVFAMVKLRLNHIIHHIR